MKILDLRKVINISDFYLLYETFLKSNFEKEKADLLIAKAKTSLIRFALPYYGSLLKLNGNLSPSETIEGLEFMQQIPIYQVVHLLNAQEQVFNQFGDRVSPASRRVYRSALKKMLDWGESQDWWKQSIETSSIGKTPKMIICKKRVEHWHKLKPQEISTELSQQLEQFTAYLNTLRQPPLVGSSCIRYRREVLCILGWMYRFKKVALADLNLTNIVPLKAVHDKETAEEVVALAKEYFEWARVNLGDKSSILEFALRTLIYIAEYIHHDYTETPEECSNEPNN